MTEQRSPNPKIIHDAAAQLFWTLAGEVGVAGANQAVIESAGHCLMEMSFTANVLRQYGFQKLRPNDQLEFGDAIAVEAEHFAIKGENMNGVIYAEDAQSGRSPSAQDVQAAHLADIPQSVTSSGAKIEKIGRLCLRHPLPAVVFSDNRPKGSLFEVADTSAALGFHLPMFLSNVATEQLGERLFVSMGIFVIPVPDTRKGNKWGMVIQNSTRFSHEAQFCGAEGSTTVQVNWLRSDPMSDTDAMLRRMRVLRKIDGLLGKPEPLYYGLVDGLICGTLFCVVLLLGLRAGGLEVAGKVRYLLLPCLFGGCVIGVTARWYRSDESYRLARIVKMLLTYRAVDEVAYRELEALMRARNVGRGDIMLWLGHEMKAIFGDSDSTTTNNTAPTTECLFVE